MCCMIYLSMLKRYPDNKITVINVMLSTLLQNTGLKYIDAMLWNQLPNEAELAESFNSFKEK